MFFLSVTMLAIVPNTLEEGKKKMVTTYPTTFKTHSQDQQSGLVAHLSVTPLARESLLCMTE